MHNKMLTCVFSFFLTFLFPPCQDKDVKQTYMFWVDCCLNYDMHNLDEYELCQ